LNSRILFGSSLKRIYFIWLYECPTLKLKLKKDMIAVELLEGPDICLFILI
jgi:hypothetical protein